jgi:hypothetical protein
MSINQAGPPGTWHPEYVEHLKSELIAAERKIVELDLALGGKLLMTRSAQRSSMVRYARSLEDEISRLREVLDAMPKDLRRAIERAVDSKRKEKPLEILPRGDA